MTDHGTFYVWHHNEPIDPNRVALRVLNCRMHVYVDGEEVDDCTVEVDYCGRLFLIASVPKAAA